MNKTTHTLLSRFQQYIAQNSLFSKDDTILLAVSGGVDSVVLTHLMKISGYQFSIAHCNFNLRGEESDRDEAFTRTLAKQYNAEIFVTHFNTYEVAYKRGISVEMAARELRYRWFDELIKDFNLSVIVTGHHLDDQIETFFINLLRGSGISGLRGMLPRAGVIVRPLLFAFRDEIIAFAAKESLPFVNDSSNDNIEYRRNKIRHQILPLLEEINPGFKEVMARNMHHLRDTEVIYQERITNNLKDIIKQKDNQWRIDIEKLSKLYPVRSYLFELLHPFGFNMSGIEDIERQLTGVPGKIFLSPTHRLIKDRSELIITLLPHKQTETEWQYYIHEEERNIHEPLPLHIEYTEINKGFTVPTDNTIACLNANKLSFPLMIRRWQEGDYFFPLGMKKKKKLSDLFTDVKLSIVDKENIWLLVNGNGDILWVIGIRINEKYKITIKTTNACKIVLKKH
ncbi:MAG: tRNA lysidine(34) synthetase TilS [Bacteroidales bacterium]|nr:tRNA lysidine(34) synthetase TilS [Bacteroidales bacterium]